MATRKRGLLTASGEWSVHLRRCLKRQFWKKERRAARREMKRQVEGEKT